MTGTDIVFVSTYANVNSEYMPFYFLYLAGYLEKHGFTCKIFNEPNKDILFYKKAALKFLMKENPRFVGLASFVTDYSQAFYLAEQIQEKITTTVIVGNAHPSIRPQDFIYSSSPFNIAVLGEGEITVSEILAGKPLEEINGIAYMDRGTMVVNPKREVMDLSECGMPAYHLIDMERYAKPTKYIIRRLPASAAVIYTGRGCPYNCGFCAANTVWNANSHKDHPLVRRRPVKDVIADLTLLEKKYGFDFFYILDDTFGNIAVDVVVFCQAYKESGLTMLWNAETRVNSAIFQHDDLLPLMKDAGCIQIDFGIETGSKRLLEVCRKNTTIRQAILAFYKCRNAGIRTFANVLLNLPTETKEDLKETVNLLDSIKPTYTSIGMTQPYPGTMFYEKYIQPVPKSEYITLNRLEPAEKFRMADHKIPLYDLLLWFQFRYGQYSPVEWSVLKTDRSYWDKLIHSKRKWQYLFSFLKLTVLDSLYEYWIMKRKRKNNQECELILG
jgi:anaerobic magnesium-protoporphyrin IX monomethyl ester cyclase